MTRRDEPTDEGRQRWEPDGYNHETDEPCTCRESCERPCKGQCGCSACHDAYMDFLSVE